MWTKEGFLEVGYTIKEFTYTDWEKERFEKEDKLSYAMIAISKRDQLLGYPRRNESTSDR